MDERCPCFVRTDSLVKKRGLYIALKGGKCIAGKKPRGVGCLAMSGREERLLISFNNAPALFRKPRTRL